ncbi:MAG: AgmX/PglI C-terminal domain-containing protein [Polyangiaceae bacterium]|nr:AgmX/PglI C-terminal domain-containing protein [Polyangiaceae bacterium]
MSSNANKTNVVNPFLGTPSSAVSGLAFLNHQNPFAMDERRADEVPEGAPEGSYAYALVKTGPDVPAEEVEVPVSSVEIMIRWGNTVLHVANLTPPRSFYVGEEQGAQTDFVLPADAFGASRAPVVIAGADGIIAAVLLPGAKGTIELTGSAPMSVEKAIQSGLAVASKEIAGGFEIPMPRGSVAKLDVNGFAFDISTGNAGRAIAGKVALDTRSLPYTALSMVLHLGLLAAAAVFMPPLAMAEEGEISREQQYLLQSKLEAMAEKELAEKQEESVSDAQQPQDKAGGTGARSQGSEGAMGSQTSTKKGGRYGIEGPKDNPDVHVAKAAALRDASTFGMIGILQAGAGGDPNAVTAHWGRDDSLGNDPKSALGNMWGAELGESAGAGGLGLTGIGEGGGGQYEGIGLGTVGTIGHGAGLGPGQGFGPGGGSSFARTGRAHKSEPPRIRPIGTTVSGRLPPEVIQRIVRQNFGRFRLCYENGLRGNPNLQGRVAVRFIIGRDGAVSSVANGGSDLPDSGVVSCVVRSFYGLSFPQPEDGIVTVTYPIMLTPGN